MGIGAARGWDSEGSRGIRKGIERELQEPGRMMGEGRSKALRGMVGEKEM